MTLRHDRRNIARALSWQLLASSFGLGLVFSACGGTVSFGSSATQNASSQGSKAGTGGVSKAEPANLPAGGSAPEEFEPSAEAQNVSGSYLVGICDIPNESATNSNFKKIQKVEVECSLESEKGKVEKLSAPQVLLALFDGTTVELESRWRTVQVVNGEETRLVFEVDRRLAKNVLSISLSEILVRSGGQVSKVAKFNMGLTSQAQEFFPAFVSETKKPNPTNMRGPDTNTAGVTSDPGDQSSKEIDNMCHALFGSGTNNNCNLPTSLFFGGTYQKGGLNQILGIKNKLTNNFSCPAGYKDWTVSDTTSASGLLEFHMCWKADETVSTQPAADCPLGQVKTQIGGSLVCSDLPKRACDSLDGNFDSNNGRCHLSPMKTVFGGVFETGAASDRGWGKFKFKNPDNGFKETEEFCETPNRIAGINSCSCPTGFEPFSSSRINERSGDRPVNDWDRLTYCVRKSANLLNAEEVLTPSQDCANPGELYYTIDGKRTCSSSVTRFCKAVGGVFSTVTEKCTLPREEFFGGSYQVGESKHYSPAPVNPQDPVEQRTQYCESPNPLSKNDGEPKDCSCPAGFQAQVFFSADESITKTAYDREYLCIKNR